MKKNKSNIKMEIIDDNSILVTYNQYKVKCSPSEDEERLIVPSKDINGLSIGYQTRVEIHDYVMNNYDQIPLPKKLIPVQPEEVNGTFEGLKTCDNNEKKKVFANGVTKAILPIIVIIILSCLFITPFILNALNLDKSYTKILIYIALIIILVVISVYINKKEMEKFQKSNVYKVKVKVFDRREKITGEGDLNYYVRIWDGKKHVLMKWFYVEKEFYKKGNSGTLYLAEINNKYNISFEEDN